MSRSDPPSSSPRTLIGVDGGGTSTRVAVCATDGRLYGVGVAGPGNYHNVGADAVRENIRAALAAAWSNAGVAPRQADAAFLGLGSVVTEADRDCVRRIASELSLAPAGSVGVDHDLRVTAAGAFPAGGGVVLVAGTGSAAYGVAADGRAWRSGGWGPTIDDGGSAFWIGVRAMQAVVAAHDGRGQPTALTPVVMQHFEISDLNQLMFLVDGHSAGRRRIASLAREVARVASEGDAVAAGLLEQGAAELARCVAAVRANLSLSDDPLRLALVGGLTQAGESFAAPLKRALARLVGRVEVVPRMLDPVDGALLLAGRTLGDVDELQLLGALQSRAADRRAVPSPHAQFGKGLESAPDAIRVGDNV